MGPVGGRAPPRSAIGDIVPPRLVASDLDGTLLRTDGSLSGRRPRPGPRRAGAGIETVLVTARPPRWLHDLEQVVGPRGTAICGNGAFVYEVATRRVLETHCFERVVLDDIVADLRTSRPRGHVRGRAGHRALRGRRLPGPAPRPGRRAGRARVVARGRCRAGRQAARAGSDLPVEEFLATVEEVVGDRGHLHFSGAHGLAEINAPGVTKAAGLERWATGLGIDAAHVWAFGDMPNDLPMLEWAGVGWAVANGHGGCAAPRTGCARPTTTTGSPRSSRQSSLKRFDPEPLTVLAVRVQDASHHVEQRAKVRCTMFVR